MFRIVTASKVAETEKQQEIAIEQIERLELELADMKIKYEMALREQEVVIKDRERMSQLASDMFKPAYEILKGASPALLNELCLIADESIRYVVGGSLKIRTVDGIAYRDGAVAGLTVFRAKITSFLKTNMKKAARNRLSETSDEADEA
jgi:hypothetical protein